MAQHEVGLGLAANADRLFVGYGLQPNSLIDTLPLELNTPGRLLWIAANRVVRARVTPAVSALRAITTGFRLAIWGGIRAWERRGGNAPGAIRASFEPRRPREERGPPCERAMVRLRLLTDLELFHGAFNKRCERLKLAVDHGMSKDEWVEHARQLVSSEIQGIGVAEEVAELAQLVQRLARSLAEDGGANARDRETGNSQQTSMRGLTAGRLPLERYQDAFQQPLELGVV